MYCIVHTLLVHYSILLLGVQYVLKFMFSVRMRTIQDNLITLSFSIVFTCGTFFAADIIRGIVSLSPNKSSPESAIPLALLDPDSASLVESYKDIIKRQVYFCFSFRS